MLPNKTRMLVFVSYRRNDVPTHSSRLYSALATVYPSNQIFFDAGDLQAGSIWSTEITRAARDCVIVACAIGPRWETQKLWEDNDPVRVEISTALENHRAVIPVLFEGARLPSRTELPPDCQGILDRQAISFDSHDKQLYEEKMTRLGDIFGRTFMEFFTAGVADATVNFVLRCSSNRGRRRFSLSVRDGPHDYFEMQPGSMERSLKLPVGVHTIELSFNGPVSGGRNGIGSSSTLSAGSYRVFFEPGTYVSEVSRWEFPFEIGTPKVSFDVPRKTAK